MSTKLQISGMTCGHCEMSVKKALEEVPGVTQVAEVSKDRGEAIVEGDADVSALIAAVEETGFEARAA